MEVRGDCLTFEFTALPAALRTEELVKLAKMKSYMTLNGFEPTTFWLAV